MFNAFMFFYTKFPKAKQLYVPVPPLPKVIFDNGADENKPPPATLGPVVDTLAFLPCESEKFNDAVNPGIEKVEDTGVVSIPPEADVVFVAGATDVPKEITDDGPVGAALAVPIVTAIIRE